MPEERRRRRWFVIGLLIGLTTFMLIFMAAQGTPGIASVVPATAHKSGDRLLVGQTDFRMVFNMASGLNGAFSTTTGPTGSTARVAGSLARVFDLLNDPRIRAALQLDTASTGTQASSLTTSVSAPGNLAPGAPTASLIQVLNRSSVPVIGQIRAEINHSGDDRACRVLRMVATLGDGGKTTQIIASGPVDQITQSQNAAAVMQPGKPYELGIFVVAPRDLGNEYQASSCTVEFMLDTHQAA